MDISTIVLFVFVNFLFWCSHLFTAALSFLGPFSAFWDAIDIEHSISIAFQLCWLFVASSTVEGVLFFLTIQRLADSCYHCSWTIIKFFLFLVSFVPWKVRGCNR